MKIHNLLPILASALGALSGVLLVLYLLDRLPLGPHAVRCDGGEGTPPLDEPVEFDTRMSNEDWAAAAVLAEIVQRKSDTWRKE